MSLIEKSEKSAQCADMLVSDLMELNQSADALMSLLILPEIAKARELAFRLNSIAFAFKSKEKP